MVVADQGVGVEAALIGNPIALEGESADGVPPVFQPLVELENMALGTWYLNVIGTIPEARRQGHAKRLMGSAEEIARAGLHDEISLIVYDANTAARSLYHGQGYRERARAPMPKEGPGAGVPGEHWLLLVKPLG